MKGPTDYIDEVARCMLTYQHVEMALKLILFRYEVLVRIRLNKYCDYKPDVGGLEKAPLERLIKRYKPYCDDLEFLKGLNGIKNDRNHIAHESLLMTHEELQAQNEVHKKTIDLESKEKAASVVLVGLLRQWNILDQILQAAIPESEHELRVKFSAKERSLSDADFLKEVGGLTPEEIKVWRRGRL